MFPVSLCIFYYYLLIEFCVYGRVYKRRKLHVNLGKSKVMRCSWYVNVINGRLNGEPFEEVDCFMYLGSQLAADEGCASDIVH